MKLHTCPRPAPNPLRVHLALAEKGVDDWQMVPVDLRSREQKSESFLKLNPLGQVPVLEFDDGQTLCESVAICRFVDDAYGEPILFGATPIERATIEMWHRRVEQHLCQPMGQIWIHTHPLTAQLLEQHPAWGEANRQLLGQRMRWFDEQLASRDVPFLAGERYTMVDISAQAYLDFGGALLDVSVPDELRHLAGWYERVRARPSASRYS